MNVMINNMREDFFVVYFFRLQYCSIHKTLYPYSLEGLQK